MTHKPSLRQRLDRARAHMGDLGEFCICGNTRQKCPYHRTGADPLMGRAADLFALIADGRHEIDYDSCSFDTDGAIGDIAAFLRGEDSDAT